MFVNLNLKISLWILVEFSLFFFESKLAYVDFFQQFGADNYLVHYIVIKPHFIIYAVF